jgi:signal transduction histidine kinase
MIDLLSELARATAGKGEPPVRQTADLGELARLATQQVRTDRKIDVAGAGDVRASVDPVRVTTAIAGVLEDVVRRGDRGAPIDIHLDGSVGDAVSISIAGGAPPAGDVPDLRLYLARHAIEAHGGSLTIDPVDRGAIVTIVLPRRTA